MARSQGKACIPDQVTEELAELIGMFIGDGSLPVKYSGGHSGQNYWIGFYNTNKSIVMDFQTKLFQIFGIKGKVRERVRKGKRPLYEFGVYDKKLYLFLESLGIPRGKKASRVHVPQKIMSSSCKIQKKLP